MKHLYCALSLCLWFILGKEIAISDLIFQLSYRSFSYCQWTTFNPTVLCMLGEILSKFVISFSSRTVNIWATFSIFHTGWINLRRNNE